MPTLTAQGCIAKPSVVTHSVKPTSTQQHSAGVTGSPNTGLVLVVMTFMLVMTMKLLGRAFGPVAELFRMALAALGALLLVGAVTVLLVVALVMSKA